MFMVSSINWLTGSHLIQQQFSATQNRRRFNKHTQKRWKERQQGRKPGGIKEEEKIRLVVDI